MNAIPPAAAALGVTNSVMGRRWVWRGGVERAGLLLAQRADLPEIVGSLLAVRGVDADGVADFLTPTLRALLPDPSVLLDMDAAASRLAHAVQHGETVGVFGDYDVDGACSSAVMALLLRGLGCPVLTHVPDRMREGYGPNAPALLALAGKGATLVVCVDCGTAAGETLAVLAGRADVLVLDHHKAEGPPPAVLATVNPNRLDDTSGLRGLCAAGVAFLAAIATLRTLRRAGWFTTRPEPDLRELLDLVALATVCDVMPLTGVNRALVTQGLKVMAKRHRPGIAALLEISDAKDIPTATTLGWALGPRINAAGRIDEADLGLRLLLSDDPVDARALAIRLDQVNQQRQVLEASVMEAAHAAAHTQADTGRAVLMVHGEGWHPGVVGIIAGRIKQRQNRPALAGALADGMIKGSGRSVDGVDLGAAVLAARRAGLLATGGGHAMAAGFSLSLDQLADFHAFLEDRLTHAATLPRVPDLPVEATVSVGGATVGLAEQIARLAPFGAGNDEP
ncbi:single-stranded-DNA-specific exonuclease RecJ, partial [Acidisphaera sp. L21]|uniref:single-stranded-DNA-specific exonuclease RecJ n=1 Tax=Acidisphaera sp. L21 TaxID=1641851 RepID=UPI00131DF9C5